MEETSADRLDTLRWRRSVIFHEPSGPTFGRSLHNIVSERLHEPTVDLVARRGRGRRSIISPSPFASAVGGVVGRRCCILASASRGAHVVVAIVLVEVPPVPENIFLLPTNALEIVAEKHVIISRSTHHVIREGDRKVGVLSRNLSHHSIMLGIVIFDSGGLDVATVLPSLPHGQPRMAASRYAGQRLAASNGRCSGTIFGEVECAPRGPSPASAAVLDWHAFALRDTKAMTLLCQPLLLKSEPWSRALFKPHGPDELSAQVAAETNATAPR